MLYGIRGPFFERTVHAKELYEIFLESFQLYRTLYHVVDPAAGYLATTVLTLNCLTTPIIYALLPHSNHRATRFLLCLVVDAMLDHISSIAIPLAVYGNYRANLMHPKYFDASWTFFMGSSLVQFVPNSLVLIGSRALPSLSMVINLHAIKSVLKRRKQLDPKFIVQRAHPAAAVSVRPAALVQHSSEMSTSVKTKTAPPAASIRSSHTGHPRWVRALHCYFVVHGLAALSLIFGGNRNAAAEGLPECQLVMSRWLVPRVPCAVLEINCRDHNTSGLDNAPLLALLDKADRNALRALSFVHCDALVMPDMIRQFPRLHWLEIRNSTLLQWPATAMLTRETTPRFSRLLVLETNLTEFPRVLYAADAIVPRTLLDVTFAGTNLSDLPATLHEAWPQPMDSVHFERCAFTRVPRTLLAMRTDALSLAGNAIRDVPAALFAGKTLSLLSLAGNPISALPDTLATPLTLRASPASTRSRGLWLVDTRVAALPAWTCALRGDVVAAGSPLCDARDAHHACGDASSSLSLRCVAPRASAASISPAGFLVY